MKKIKNPLRKRILRELAGDWKKYIVIFLFLTLTIGFVSGMYVANNSMLNAAEQGVTEYKLEYGNFELKEPASDNLLTQVEKGNVADVRQYYLDQAFIEADEKVETEVRDAYAKAILEQLSAYPESIQQDMLDLQLQQHESEIQQKIEETKKTVHKEVEETVTQEYNEKHAKDFADIKEVPVKLYPLFYKQTSVKEPNDKQQNNTIRLFQKQNEIDLASVLSGRLPKTDTEIAIDRMHAENAGLQLGDTLIIENQTFTITGLIAYVNYSTLFEKNTDMMFDALQFDVGMLTKEGYEKLHTKEHYVYAWMYETEPVDEIEEKQYADSLMKIIVSQALVSDNEMLDYIPRYANQAIQFATSDMGSDKTMGGALLYILIVVLGFIFAVTVNTTIEKEATVIGTLRANGYTVHELLWHYLSSPIIVTLLSAIIGHLAGYTLMKNIVVGMYYNSYSLPAYQTVFSYEALLKTTVVPVALMLVINYVVILKKLSLSPLQFLRHNLSTSKRKKAMRLPKWKFVHRFQARIFLQNIPNYLTLLLGIYFVLLLMVFATALPETLHHYMDHISDTMFAKYQVVLKNTVDEDGNDIETQTENVEKYSMTSLQMMDDHAEEISVYGLQSDSAYITLPDLSEQETVISQSFSEKYGLREGDVITLKEKYSNDTYDFTIKDVNAYHGTLSMFMNRKNFNETFEKEDDDWNGYLSDKEINDIDDRYIYNIITVDDVTKVARQLEHSMGDYMQYFQYVCIVLAMVLIYLLTKVIIEKNEKSISMIKILGYETKEIAKLYLMSTTVMVILSEISALGLAVMTIDWIWGMMLKTEMDGWLPMTIHVQNEMMIILTVFLAYCVVMLLDVKRIRRIRMDEALKNME